MAELTMLIVFNRLLAFGGALDSQTTDTQYFGFEAVESQPADVEDLPQRDQDKLTEMTVPTRDLNAIIADIRKAREDLTALENELVTTCMTVTAVNAHLQVRAESYCDTI